MKKIYSFALCFLLALVSYAAPFTAGNIVVVRMGTGAAALSSAAAAVFLDEYTPAGTLVQTIQLPTSVSGTNLRLTNSGSATSEGSINLSSNRSFLTVAGYDADAGTASVNTTTSATVKRVVGIVDENGVINTTTGLTDAYSANNIRGAYTTNGTAIWTSGTASSAANGYGVRYTTTGASISTLLSTTVTNLRAISIYNGQLYVTSGSAGFIGVDSVGSGIPTTSGQTTTLLPGFSTQSASSPYGFDIKPGTGDTIYVADERTTTLGGIQKWVLSSGTYTLAYTINPATGAGARGITVDWKTKPTTIYATGTNNVLYKITDNYNAAASTSTALATAPANTAFRGVAFAPGTVLLPVKLLSFTATPKNDKLIFNWKTATETNTSHFEIEQSVNGREFTKIATVFAAGNSTVEKSYSYTGSLNNITTYYRLKMLDADGKFTTSTVLKISNSKNEFALGNVYPVPAKNNVTIEWNSNHAGNTDITLTDLNGRTIRTVNVQSVAGFNQFVLGVQTLSTGQYFIRIKNEANIVQATITKQ